jgi:hypothetical protein
MTTIFIVRLLLRRGAGKGPIERIAGLGGELGDQGRDELKVIGVSERRIEESMPANVPIRRRYGAHHAA